MLDIIEKELNGVLSENFEGFDVDSFPAKFEDFNFRSHNGCILIRYDGSSFSNQETILSVKQTETYSYSIIMGLRYCRHFKDCYKWISKLKETLHGFVANGYRVVLKKAQFLDEINTDLWWGISINIVQEIQDDNKAEYWWNAPPVCSPNSATRKSAN